jgi:anion-transporting  ArsA/GET3 family ATPase
VSSDWPRVRLHVVTGKGGTGKTTVALALALASQGKNVLVCEVEGRQGLARMFDVDPLPYAETLIATGLRTGPDGAGTRPGTVHALHIDPESALLEYLAMYYRLGRAGKALDRFGVIEFATTIAPGVRDVLLTGKVFEAVQRNSRNKGAIQYDAVVLDAPPTGRITQFLNVSDELAGLAKVGPIKSQADTMMTLFRSPRTAVHLVTVLEEMPVQETADGIEQRVGAIVAAFRNHQFEMTTGGQRRAAASRQAPFARQGPFALIDARQISRGDRDLAGACQREPLIGHHADFLSRREVDRIHADPALRGIGEPCDAPGEVAVVSGLHGLERPNLGPEHGIEQRFVFGGGGTATDLFADRGRDRLDLLRLCRKGEGHKPCRQHASDVFQSHETPIPQSSFAFA